MRIRILYHDHCFDGAASAAFFSRFMRGQISPGCRVPLTRAWRTRLRSYSRTSCSTATRTRSWTSSTRRNPKLTWWFDHHQSAFLTPEDAEHFRTDRSGKKLYDPMLPFLHQVHLDRRPRDVRTTRRRIWPSWSTGPTSSTARSIRDAQGGGGAGSAGDETDAGDRRQPRARTPCRRSYAGCVAVRSKRSSREPEIQALYRPLYERHLTVDRHHPRAVRSTTTASSISTSSARPGRLQQVHSLLSVSRVAVHGLGEHVDLPHQGVGRLESMGGRAAEAQSGDDLRTLWRRRHPGWARSASRSARWNKQGTRRQRSPGTENVIRDGGRFAIAARNRPV